MAKKRRLPPLRSMVSFEALARHTNIRDAAAELDVTQSAVSHQLRQLEEHLAVCLFRRTRRGLVLTEAGKQLQPVIEQALNDIEGVTGHLTTKKRDVIRVGILATSALTIYMQHLQCLRAALPEGLLLHFQKIEHDDDLDSLDIDIALQVAPENQLLADGWQARRFSAEIARPYAALSWLEKQGLTADTVEPQALTPLDLLLVEDDPDVMSQLALWLDLGSFDVTKCWSFSHHVWAVQAAVAGCGIVVASEQMVQAMPNSALLEIAAPHFVSSWQHSLMWRREHSDAPFLPTILTWFERHWGG